MQEFWYCSGVAEVSVLLGYDATSPGNWFLMFSCDMASCHRRTETLRYVFPEPFRPVTQWHPCLLLSQCLTLESF